MKKYLVGCRIDDSEQHRGTIPHSDIWDTSVIPDYVKADSPEEAIDYALDYTIEHIGSEYDYDVDRDECEIKIYNADGKLIECYFDFRAKEIED